MILQYLSKVEVDGKKQVIETVKDNVTEVTEFVDKIEVTFSRKNGELYSVFFQKNHHQIFSMWLLNDNFKTLKRLI